ncbi:MAG TPA: HNH endonuclease [Edaphobacter sp.]|nr:HNH endonuclease [Edaphobacter sp.]
MANKIPQGISREHILAALHDLDRGIPHSFRGSTRYDLLYENRRYPPKAVIGLAAGKLSGSPLGPYDFKGGSETICFNTLRRNGFKIVSKTNNELPAETQLRSGRATWLEDVITGLSKLGGIASLGDIYTEAKKYRSDLPKSFEAIIRRTVESNSSDSSVWNKKDDIFYSAEGIGKGVWGLRSMLVLTPHAADINNPGITGGTTTPGRSLLQTYRILRDTTLCREIKGLYKNMCQLCGFSIALASGDMYSEAHHIVPLGAPHQGSDVAGNILVVCPNHHAMLDYCAISLDISRLTIHEKHEIFPSSLAYHNQMYRSRFLGSPDEMVGEVGRSV